LVETIPGCVAGKIQPKPQPSEGVSYAPKIKKEDGRIDWAMPAQSIVNHLRAFTPWPGLFTFLPEQPAPHLLKVWKAEAVEAASQGAEPGRAQSAARPPRPGEILRADKHEVVVACGMGALRVLELQREGGRRMGAAEFLAGHPLAGKYLVMSRGPA